MPLLTQSLAITLLVTRTITIFRAPRAGQLVGFTVAQETATDGTKNVKLRNLTRGVDMTPNPLISGVAAGGSVDVGYNNDGTAFFAKGDVIALVYTVAVAGAVAPTNLGIMLDVLYGQMNDSGIA